MNKLFIDFETRSHVNIKTVGAWKYAMDPSTEIMCLAVGEEGRSGIDLIPREEFKKIPVSMSPFVERVKRIAGIQLIAHNAHFEYAIWNYILAPRYGWPFLLDPGYWGCTMSRAAMCGLPLSLESLSTALKCKTPKDLEGRRVMLKLTHPNAETGEYNEDPTLYSRLYQYCVNDVKTEMEVDTLLPELPESEREVWELDLIMNSRGVQVDVTLARSAMQIADYLTSGLNARLSVLTNGAVSKASRVEAIKTYLASQGVKVSSLDKTAVTSLLARPDFPQVLKDVISIRRQVGKSSTAKYAKILETVSPVDDRVRGTLQYHAAATGRWGGRGAQPQNFPQGFKEGAEQEGAISLINSGDPSLFSLVYGDGAMQTLSDTLRGTIIAPIGKVLMVADYSAIEARILFWEAGDEVALSMYRWGMNLYEAMGRFIYGREVKKGRDPKEYDVGKRTILGCGYGMWKDKFLATCLQYGVDIDEATSLKAVKAYREKYKSVVNMWYGTERAAKSAVKNPASVQTCMAGGMVKWGMSKDREFLVCRLPSGRHLRYYHPSIKVVDGPRGEKEEIHYWGTSINGDLEEFKTYGGSLVENITQATARDIMANGMLNCEKTGEFPIVLTVHDEVVAEVAEKEEEKGAEAGLNKFIKLLCSLPSWAEKCPITAEGWVGRRDRK